MSRLTALLLAFLAMVPPAFSADPAIPTRNDEPFQVEDVDPATGLSRTTVVRPLRDFPPAQDPRRPSAGPVEARRHVALILPTLSPALGRLAEAVRLGFVAAFEAAGRETLPVQFIPVDSEAAPLVEACRLARRTGAVLVVGGLTRDGATTLAKSECARQPVLALNEPQGFGTRGGELGPGDLPPNLFHITLSLEHEARQVALQAVADGWHSAIVITSPSPLARRVQEAFEREWIRAAGELRRVSYSGSPDDAPILRQRIADMRADMVFLALDQPEARQVRPYITGALPVYATSMSIDPRAEPAVNVDLQGVRYLDMPWFVQPDHTAVMAYRAPKGTLPVEEERLFALGIDAFRLALLILRADGKPAILDGVTGRIVLGPGNAFLRTLVAAEVDGGRVVPAKSP